jgi:hypothetical protein
LLIFQDQISVNLKGKNMFQIFPYYRAEFKKQKITLKNGVFLDVTHAWLLLRTEVSENLSASIIRVTIIGELRKTLAVTRKRRTLRRFLVTASVFPSSLVLVTLMKEALCSSETSILTRATLCNVSEDAILHSHHREDLESYKILRL